MARISSATAGRFPLAMWSRMLRISSRFWLRVSSKAGAAVEHEADEDAAAKTWQIVEAGEGAARAVDITGQAAGDEDLPGCRPGHDDPSQLVGLSPCCPVCPDGGRSASKTPRSVSLSAPVGLEDLNGKTEVVTNTDGDATGAAGPMGFRRRLFVIVAAADLVARDRRDAFGREDRGRGRVAP